jgi:hypothetical protein
LAVNIKHLKLFGACKQILQNSADATSETDIRAVFNKSTIFIEQLLPKRQQSNMTWPQFCSHYMEKLLFLLQLSPYRDLPNLNSPYLDQAPSFQRSVSLSRTESKTHDIILVDPRAEEMAGLVRLVDNSPLEAADFGTEPMPPPLIRTDSVGLIKTPIGDVQNRELIGRVVLALLDAPLSCEKLQYLVELQERRAKDRLNALESVRTKLFSKEGNLVLSVSV